MFDRGVIQETSWMGEQTYLQLGEGEASAGAHLPVVLDRGAANDGAQLVDGTRGDGRGFG